MRAALSRFLGVLVSLSLCVPLFAQTNYNGIWTGTFNLSSQCSNGSFNSSGPASGYFSQSGSQVTGAISLDTIGVPDENCQQAGTYLLVVPVSGTVSGSSLVIPGELHASDITVTTFNVITSVNGNTMTLGFKDENGAAIGGGTLQRTDTTPQATSSGASTGGYSASDQWAGLCTNTISYSGSFTGSATRAGSLVAADGSVTGDKFPQPNQDGTCSTIDGAFTSLTFSGKISGNSVTGSILFVGAYSFTGTISGNTITGTAVSNQIPGFSSTVQLSLSVQPTTGGGGTPKVTVSELPAGMLQPSGQAGATDKFSLTNTGDAAAQVTLTPGASFYTLSTTSLSLAPGQTQVILVTGKAQPAGTYSDNVSISGSGVPSGTVVKIQLASVAAPTGSVNATTTVGRVDTVSTGNTASGSIQFTNTGSDTLTGLVTADVPWLTPTNPIVTIPPGQTATINFTIDRTKRPDADALVGSVSCNLFLTFLTGGTGAKPVTLANTSTRTVAVPVQDTAKPSVTAGSPSPLSAGEIALFMPGMRSSDRVVSDLILANPRSASVNDVKLFAATSAASPASVISVPTLSGDAPAAYAAIARNAFNFTGQSASVELRSAQASSLGATAIQISTPAGRASYATAIPVLRSDGGAASSEKLFLPGVEKGSALTTTLDVQEMTGKAMNVLTEFLKSDGSVLSSRTDSLGAFGFLEVPDAVPSGASSIRLTNQTSGARLGAYARINDATSGDSFTVVDPKATFAGASGDLIVPVFAGATSSVTRFVDVVNSSSSSTSVNVTTVGGSQRRHAARSHGTTGATFVTPQIEASQTLTLGGQQSTRVNVDAIANGFLRLNSASPVVANGRFVITSNGATFGSALPAIPASTSLAVNQGRRFTGVSDASAQTITAATPGTYRPTLMLIETAGQSAKVRVTLNYTLPGGSRAVSSATAQREFTVNASQSLVVSDLAASVIGSSRNDIGDLRNMQVDVDVIDGAGRVIPVIGMVDNSTGDLMVRAQ